MRTIRRASLQTVNGIIDNNTMGAHLANAPALHVVHVI